MTEQELTQLAAKVAKSLHWAAFLAGACLFILLIDLQLKRSIARQAMAASQLISRGTHRLMDDLIKGGPDAERTPVAETDRPGSDAGDSGRDDVGRDATLGTGGAGPVSESTAEADGLPASPRNRAPRNGPRARRDTGG